MENNFLIGSHVSMSGSKMLLGAAEEANSYGENTFMVYTGAPQNTVRKSIDKFRIEDGHAYMNDHNIKCIVVHAPYIINLANNKKLESYKFAIQFLHDEIERSEAIGATQIVLHPGSHVGLGEDKGIENIAKGLNEVIDSNQSAQIALETMAGKGTEVGRNFEQLASIMEKVDLNEKLSVTFDTCHTNDAGYDVKNNFDDVLNEFDKVIGLPKLKVVHLNDSKNPTSSHKDRHEIIGLGTIGFDSLDYIAHHESLINVPKIMETPIVKLEDGKTKKSPHYFEVEMLKNHQFNSNLMDDIKSQK
ncbi:endonuclease 4 [Apilactobacillus ozensis DSM 23829 = JCM 17196]|uniref:Probable endonuclease 4 n=1 Tax=Apilactobacillus ozensis DSM 23829 = JCM 17196 TaxID=1423781 RepID=A0A0R2AMY3_9LACO|nr:deoxyribonuclease IV [Apilactobacillus ozensis]KRM67842.1 endonuclease 4 [Apilactobacillus ozensis DSM 23829 = JCM 17196]